MELIWIWLGMTIVLAIMEAATVNLVTIWFAGGALAAMIAAVCGAPLWLQAVIFLVVSAALLLALRPFAKRLTKGKTVPTNADRNIGKTAVVVEPIDALRGTGRVMIGSVDWTARSADGSVIEKGALVRVLHIEGVKVTVERAGVGATV